MKLLQRTLTTVAAAALCLTALAAAPQAVAGESKEQPADRCASVNGSSGGYARMCVDYISGTGLVACVTRYNVKSTDKFWIKGNRSGSNSPALTSNFCNPNPGSATQFQVCREVAVIVDPCSPWFNQYGQV